MKCPNCGANIPEGKLYCEACGAELQIVPDIDVDFDVESEMKKTLSNIAKNEFSDDLDDDFDFDDDPNLLSYILSGKAGGKIFYSILAIVLVAILIAAVVLGKRISSQKSLDYQLEKAEEYIQSNNLLQAISYLEEAYKIDKDSQYLFKIADYYYTLGRENDAIFTLINISTGEFARKDKEEAYRKIFTLYETSGNYRKIADLLETCEVESILDEYSDYRVIVPSFNYDGGTYNETIAVKASSAIKGKVHYTIDGSTPTKDSPVFDSPIFLEYGSYTINAVFENRFGELSEVVSNKYLIDVDFVFEPTILTESGEYHEATQIEADVPVMYNLFYTTDGSDPDRNSTKYTGPIQMPLGITTYKFVSYATDGTQSAIVEREYDLNFGSDVTEGSALFALKSTLMDKGINLDLDGHRPGVDGNFLYVFTTAYKVLGQNDAFFIVEYYVNTNGTTTKTGTVFGVDVYNENNIYIVQPKDNDYMRVDF